jgi:hypothetical protein
MDIDTPHIINFKKTKKGKTKLFIKDVYVNEIALFGKVAGLAGVAIYLSVKFKIGISKMDGFYPVTNKDLQKYKPNIHRNTKYDALRKLKEESLIEYYSDPKSGKSTQVRLLTNDKR